MSLVLKKHFPFYFGKNPVYNTARKLPVIHKYTGEVITEVSAADASTIKQAAEAAKNAKKSMHELPPYKRKEILLSVANQINDRKEELAQVLCAEVGKTITDARGEIGRAIDTFTISAEESVRQNGKFQNLEISQRNAGYQSIVSRFPVGVISMIVPFNFPVNLAAHKIGPAIATGCPFILKPSERTPLTAVLMGEILSNTGLPDNSFSILPCELSEASLFSTDPNLDFVSFTGSAKVGWHIKSTAGKKKVALELGGNAACIVDSGVNLDHVVNRAIFGGFAGNGQSCISVQRMYVHSSIYAEFSAKFTKKVSELSVGNPASDKTQVGPLIGSSEADRLHNWINKAVDDGAKLLVGGKKEGSFLHPTVLEKVPAKSTISCEEAFGPVVNIAPYNDFKEVIREVNNSAYGLQAGVFTNDINKAFYAYNNLHVGGVVINDVPTSRVDAMPYGGIKDSGLGREGIVYTMEEFTEVKVMLMKDIGNVL